MRQHPAKTLALAVCGCTALWSVQAAAQSGNSQPSLEQLQQQIQQLQQQVQEMKTQQEQQLAQQKEQQASSASVASQSGSKSNKKLTISGRLVGAYNYSGKTAAPHQTPGGDLDFGYFDLGVAGDMGNGLTYGADYRWSPTDNFAGGQMLHNAWIGYDFGPDNNSQVIGGLFQVPFGNYPTGYESWWGGLGYYTGANDNQAAGLGYKYEANNWRLDIDAFKNDDFGMDTTYGAGSFDGYDQINGGNARLAYTFKPAAGTVNVSGSVRGGQLEVDHVNDAGHSNGNHWAAAVAADAELGNWSIMGQYTDYRYNVPDGSGLPKDSVAAENYGYGYLLPASGQLFEGHVLRSFPVSNLGPVDAFAVYDDYGYLLNGGDGHYGDYDDYAGSDGDTQLNVFGVSASAGPLGLYAEWLAAKNGAMAFVGPNNSGWHNVFHLTATYSFDGDLIQ